MNIEAHNPYETEKKSNHEALYKSRLLRTKKQKSIEGMYCVSVIKTNTVKLPYTVYIARGKNARKLNQI
jgi:hypothetical protein